MTISGNGQLLKFVLPELGGSTPKGWRWEALSGVI